MTDKISSSLSLADMQNRMNVLEQTAAKTGPTGKSLKEMAKIRELSKEFESVFLEQMLSTMRQSVEKSKFIDGGNAEDIYRSMLDSEYSKQMAAQHMTGIADNIEKSLLQAAGLDKIKSMPHGKESGIPTRSGLRSYEKQRTIELGRPPKSKIDLGV